MKIKTPLLASTLLFLLLACTSSHINEKRIDNSAFPPEFNCKECVLLVMKRSGGMNPNGINRYVENSFRKNYSGKYQMATHKEIDTDPKYQDKNIYRFIVSDEVNTGGNKTTTTTISNGMTTNKSVDYNYTYSMDFRIYDRLKEKSYPSLGVASNVPAKAINRTTVILNKRLTQ